jgi:hypothetical protein
MGDLERLLRPIGRAARRQPIGRTDPRSAAQARPHAPTRYASVPPTRERHGVFEGPPVCIDVMPAMLRSGPLQVSAGEETQGRPQDLRRAGRASSARPYVTSRGSCNSPRHRGQHSGWHDVVVFLETLAKTTPKAIVWSRTISISTAGLHSARRSGHRSSAARRFKWHYTPKHGSWLDLADSELGILYSQCLDRRIPDKSPSTRLAPGSTSEMQTTPRPIGTSYTPARESNSSTSQSD